MILLLHFPSSHWAQTEEPWAGCEHWGRAYSPHVYRHGSIWAGSSYGGEDLETSTLYQGGEKQTNILLSLGLSPVSTKTQGLQAGSGCISLRSL